MPRLKLKKLTSPLSHRQGGGRDPPVISNWHQIPDGTISRRFGFGSLLGKGAIGHVFGAVERSGTGKAVAVKVVTVANLTAVQLGDLENEVEILSHLHHANVIHLKRAFRDSFHCYLVMGLVRGVELFEKIIDAGHIAEAPARGIMWQLGTALAYLHAKGIAHRDIKPENVLVGNGHHPKVILADFGLSVKINSSSPAALRRFCGTPLYVAPEIVCRATHGFKADVYSLGVLMYVVLTGEPPFQDEGNNNDVLFSRIRTGDVSYSSPMWLNGTISMEARELVQKMMQIDPVKRLSAQQVLGRPWFAPSSKAISKSRSNSVSSLTHDVASRHTSFAGASAPTLAVVGSAGVVDGSRSSGSSSNDISSSSDGPNLKVDPCSPKTRKNRMLHRQRTQSFARFARVVSRCHSLVQDLPRSPLRLSQRPLPSSSSSSSSTSSSFSPAAAIVAKAASVDPAGAGSPSTPPPASSSSSSFSSFSSPTKASSYLPASLDLPQFSAWVATYGLCNKEAKLAFRLLDFNHDDTVDSSEIKRTMRLAQRMCRSTLTQWVYDALDQTQQLPSSAKRQKIAAGQQGLSPTVAVKAVNEKAPKIVAEAFRAAVEYAHQLRSSHREGQLRPQELQPVLQRMDSRTRLILPAWATEAIQHTTNTGDIALHFMFNPALNRSWSNDIETNRKIQLVSSGDKKSTQRLVSSPSSSLSSSPGHAVRARDRLIKRELLIEMSARINAPGLRKRDIVIASLDTVCALTNAERCTVFLLSEDGREVVSFVLGGDKLAGSNRSSAMAGEEEYTCIRVKLGKGIAGTVALTGESLIINDPGRDARWDSNSDQVTGFHTRNMICVPVTTWKVREKSNSSEVSRDEYIIGCVQVLNAKSEDGFTETDLAWLEEWKTVIGVELAAAHDHRDVTSA